MAILRKAGVEVLVDIREKPISRVADFRANSLSRICDDAKIDYEGWPELGSTEAQRDRLKETGDFGRFENDFRRHVRKCCEGVLDRLATKAKSKPVALLCYERSHEECHRSVVAELLADRIDATIVAL
jgi:uncharacterized protein (DUF488 family)